MDAQPGPLLGRRVGDVPTVQPDHATGRRLQAGGDIKRGRLAGPVGPEKGEHLSSLHLEIHAEEDLHVPVAEVDVAQLQDRDVGRIGLLALVLLLLLLELDHHQGEIVRMKCALRMIMKPPMMVEGIMMISTAARTPNDAVEHGSEDGAPGRPDEEDVDARPPR